MRIEKILPDETGRTLAAKILQFKSSSQVGLLFNKYHFLSELSAGAFSLQDWNCKVLLQTSWSETTQSIPELPPALRIEEVLVVHGFEPDLHCWRDLALHSKFPMHLLLQPLAIVSAAELANQLRGQPLDSVYLDFSRYSGDSKSFCQTLETRLPGFKATLLFSALPYNEAEKANSSAPN